MTYLPYDIHGKRMDRITNNLKWISYQNYLDDIFLRFTPKCPSARLRKNENEITRDYTFLSTEAIDHEIENLVLRRRDSKKELELKKNLASEQAKITISKLWQLEHESNFSDKKIEMNLEKNMEIRANTEPNNKKSFGLKLAVADFSQKVIDNEDVDLKITEDYKDSGVVPMVSDMTVRYSQIYANKILTPVEKFIRAIKTINLILKATTTNAEQSKKREKQYLTFTDDEIETKENVKSNALSDLAFNVSDFKSKKEKTLSNEAIKILKTHKSLRTPQQIHVVVLSLTDTVEAFSEFPKAMQEALVRNGWYERYNPKQVIIRQGHAAQNFYFIISGLTVVSIAKKNNITGDSCEETVAFLKKGNSFGELALMYGGKRNATVSCMNNVELLSVTREDFVEIFMNLATDTEPEHINFLRQVPILDGWPIYLLPYDNPKICLFTYFRRGTVLCRDSKNSEWIYILRSGTCRVIKSISESFGKNYKLRYNPLKIEGTVQNAHSHQQKAKMVYIQLCALQPKDVFGLQSVAFEVLGDYSSVTLVSDGAECVAISKKFFCENMPKIYLRKLRFELQPYPEERVLTEKFQNYMDWHSFQKEYTSNFLQNGK